MENIFTLYVFFTMKLLLLLLLFLYNQLQNIFDHKKKINFKIY